MKTSDLLSSTGETLEYARLYAEQQGDYLKLEAAKRMAKTTSQLITIAVVSLLAFMVLLFFTIAVGFMLGSALGSYGISFLIITVFYAIAAILIYSFKKQLITNPVVAIIISDLLD